MVYTADERAIRENQQAVDDAMFEKQVSILEKELELLNEQKDKLSDQRQEIEDHYTKLIDETNKYYDEAIKGIQEYKKQWEELAELEEQVKMQVTLESLGISLEQILSMDQGTFEAFKQNYIGILGDIYRENGHMSDTLKSQVGDYASYMASMEPLFNRLEGINLTDTNTALATCGEHFQTIMDNIAAIDPEAAILGFESITRSANGVISAINGQGGESEGESSETNIVDSFSEAGDSIVGTVDEKISPAMDNAKTKVQEVSQEINGAEGSLLEQIQLVSSEPFEITFNVKVNGAEQIQGLTGGKYSLTGTTNNGFTEYDGTVGNAFANGYPGLPVNTSNALRSEYGQPELTVYPDGTYELTTTPTLSDLPKDTVIFSEEQTKRILKNSNANSFKGKSFADGTSYLPLQDIMPDKADMFARFEANIQDNLDKMKYNISDMTSNVRDIARTVTNNMVNNNGNTVNVGDINVTCPGVTEAEVAKNLGAAIRSELNGVVSGMALRANQKAMRR